MPTESTLKLFAIQAHALKSASATIGSEELAKEAEVLEIAAVDKNFETIEKNLDSFYNNLVLLTKRINTALEQQTGVQNNQQGDSSISVQLTDLLAALKEKSVKNSDHVLGELELLPLDEKTKKTLTIISDHVLMSEYEKASTLVKKLLKKK
jgi:HPt (histidine-containing phosphotransfer) domain-containing protein